MAKINWLVDMCEPSFCSMQHLMINKSVIVKKNKFILSIFHRKMKGQSLIIYSKQADNLIWYKLQSCTYFTFCIFIQC